ncbi:MAG TPA: TIGR04283 family arsenosugar biosynthesis glycosyltransferase [Abditibacteriaceae bacterium]|jgi:rSAM/selenodomain-associated transferase 2|nr:TIGR04283 family arsenosugar biosynthesis glycosyltransferase [Abditibacteriaceae bacterium]
MRAMISPLRISAIVPALNEAENLAQLLGRLNQLPEVLEMVVCDGGSTDRTRHIALKYGARVVQTAANRGAQMNAGATVCSGEILWFLHADTFPALSSTRRIVESARETRIIGGNFRLRFAQRTSGARIVEIIARVLRRFGIYYGDSGIWVKREVFDQLGGFENWPLFEDYDFARRLEREARRRGAQTVCIAVALRVSSRGFRGGTLRLLARWCRLQLLFWLGKSPFDLAKLYAKK